MRDALLQLNAVRDCHVLPRRGGDSVPEYVAYIVAPQAVWPEQLRTALDGLGRAARPIAFVPLSHLPRTASGNVDEDTLAQIPVVTEWLVQRMEETLRELPQVQVGAVLVQSHRPRPSPLHMADLCPDWLRQTTLPEVQQVPRGGGELALPLPPAAARPPSESDGGSLAPTGERPAILPQILERAAADRQGKTLTFPQPDGNALVWTYGDLLAAAQRICGGLQRQGLRPQDRVILQLTQNHDVLPAFWGCLLGGMVPLVMDVPSSYEPSNRAFDQLCQISALLDCPLMVTDESLLAGVLHVQNRATGLQVVRLDDLRDAAPATQHHASQPEEVAFLCFTSGSTGIPKCIELTHRCVIHRNTGANLHNGHAVDDVNLNWLPFDHIGSVTEHIRSMQLPCDLVYVHKEEILSDPLNLLQVIDRYRVTHTWGPNFIYALILDALKEPTKARAWDLSCVRFLISGGEPASYAMMKDFLARTDKFGFPATGFRPSFGMAELSAGVTYYEPSAQAPLGFHSLAGTGGIGEPVRRVAEGQPGATLFANLGRPIPGCKIRIVDQQGQILPEETIGRVQVGGEPVARGYLKNPALSSAVFLAGGWLETDDLGYLSQGCLVLTGRSKEMLILHGANYYSRELEEMVEAIDGVEVSFTAACGVRREPGEPEQLAIFFHTARQDGKQKRELIAQIRQTIVSRAHLNPAYIVPVQKSEIPKTPIGKIRRGELSQQFARGAFAAALRGVDLLLENENTLPDWFLIPSWRPAQPVMRAPEELRGTVLLFGDAGAASATIAERLRTCGLTVGTVTQGSDFAESGAAFIVDPEQPEHYARLFKSVLFAGQPIKHIVYLWNFGAAKGAPSSQPGPERTNEQALREGPRRLLLLIQAAAHTLQEQPVRLLYFDERSQCTAPGEPVEPARASVRGLLHTLSHEFPQTLVSHVDLPVDDAENVTACVLREFFAHSKEPEVAYRQGQRLVGRFVPPDWTTERALRAPFKEAGVYLLVGGLGGIGVHLASHLLQRYRAKLILTGRKTADAQSAALAALRRLGGGVEYVQADVCDAAQMQSVADRISRQGLHLDAVIQLAGSFEERLLVDESPAHLFDALGAMAQGCWLLDQLFGSPSNPSNSAAQPTCFVHVASLSGAFGSFGGAAYSAVHAYLTGFSHLQRSLGRSAYCLAFTQWQDTGLNRNRQQQDALRVHKGFNTILPRQGIAAFAAALSHDPAHLAIGLDRGHPAVSAHIDQATASLQQLQAYATLRAGPHGDVDAAAPPTALRMLDRFGSPLTCALSWLPSLPLAADGSVDREMLRTLLAGGKNQPAALPRNPLEQTLTEIWQEVLKIKVGIHDNFFELGGDSIKAVMVMNLLQKKVQGIFHPVSIFDAPTIAACSDYLKENYPLIFQKHAGKDGSAASARLTSEQMAHMRNYLATRLAGSSVGIDDSGRKNRQAVFILSPARSGSTLLRVILAGNPQLFSPPELYLLGFTALKERSQRYSGRLGFLREGVVRALMELLNCNSEEADRQMAAWEAQDLRTKEVYARLQSYLGDRLLVDKTPPYAFHPTVLARTDAEFEDALYIHLLRHPAGMIRSFEEVRVDLAVDVHGDEDGATPLTTRQKGELWWQISHQNILDFLARIPARRQHAVRFEDLVSSPESVIRRMCSFLGVSFHPNMLEPQKASSQRMLDGTHHFSRLAGDPKFHTHQGITAAAAERWREDFPEDILSDETWRLAQSFGYERPGHTASLTDYRVTPDPEQRLRPFPLTDIQQAYWAGRSRAFELGGRSVHSYTEVEGRGLDLTRLRDAWQRMIERHEMLRAVILPDGTQQFLATVPTYTIVAEDLRLLPPAERAAALRAVRERMSHQVLACDVWPLFEITVSLLPEDRFRIHFSFDAILFDARSKYILFSEFGRFYRDSQLRLEPLTLSFRDYVLCETALKQSPLFTQARDYWMAQLPNLPPPPELPLLVQPASLQEPVFIQKNHTFSSADWGRLKRRAAQAQLTPSCLLLTVFSDVLRVWNRLDRFTLNLTAYRRLPLHPQVNDIIGDFSSVILMEIDAAGGSDFITRAKGLQKRLLSHLNHTVFSGIQVLRELARQRDNHSGVQVPVVFTSVLGDEIRAADEKPLAWLGDVVYNVTQTPQIWFDHVVFEEAGELLCRWNIVEALFPPGLMDDLFSAYIRQLKRLMADDAAWQERWPETARRLLPAEQQVARANFNATAALLPTGLLHDPFVEQVRLRPHQPAVLAADRTLDYQTLYELGNRLGNRLQQLGAMPNQLVAIVLEKGWEQVVAVLGVLASGAAYLPLDPELPEERLRALLLQGQARIVLTQTALKPLLALPDDTTVLCVDDDSLAAESARPPAVRQSADDLAYVIFTSGTTGQPKGVVIDHRGALNTILDINRRFAVSAEDRVLALSALSFDLSVYDLFGVLAAGGGIVMPAPRDVHEPARWSQLIEQHQVTLWNTVPAFLGVLLDYADGRTGLRLSSLRLLMLSGDWIPVSMPEKITRIVGSRQVVSLGGATEASIWSIAHPIDAVDPAWKSIPYGRPLSNQSFEVLSSALTPVPDWVPGLLYIGGSGLAKGYFRDPQQTSERFITHPHTGEKLYCTGDLGRFIPTPQGVPTIEFLGREDSQVKIQGFRVELGEIEAALVHHPAVRNAVVAARGARHAEKQLVAYVVPASDHPELADVLRRHLKSKLPSYMIPAQFVLLPELPLSANGKVDRKRLPEPRIDAAKKPAAADRASRDGSARSAEQRIRRIADIVAGVIEQPDVATQENLFSLGATSIHMMRIINELEKELGTRLSIEACYHAPSVAGLAAACERLQDGVASAPAAEERPPAPIQLPAAMLERYPHLYDPAERERFKDQHVALRSLETPYVQLEPSQSAELARLRDLRRSHRHFSSEPIPLSRFSELLGCLQQFEERGLPRHLYASAGGLYPVQTYLYVKPGRVAGIEPGAYYYHPVEHRLRRVSAPLATGEPAELDERIYNPHINRPIWHQAAFGIFLVAQLAAILPMYREWSLHFSVLEAGLIAQLLESHAGGVGLGLCQVGEVQFERVRSLFALDDSHVLVHSLLGGIPRPREVEEF